MSKKKKKKIKQNIIKNEIYENNLILLKKYYPKIAEKLEKTVIKKFKIVFSRSDKLPNIYTKATKSYYYKTEGPLEDAIAQVKNLKLKNAKIAFFLGLGLGYEFFYFAEYMAKDIETKYIFIVEKEIEIFKLAMENIDLRLIIINPQLKLIVGAEESELFHEYREFFDHISRSILYIKTVKPIYHISALKLSKNYYLEALRKFKEAGLYRLDLIGNAPHDSLIGIQNMFNNINEILNNPGINLLFNKFENRPAVVVSTGPSLNKNKHLLKGLEEKALIICPDASLKILIEMGVKPHLVTSLERVPETVNLLKGFEENDVENVYFAGCPVIPNECYRVYTGPKVIVYRQFDHFKWTKIERGMLGIKSSAGNMAFNIAEALGCNPIVLIGQDLAYSRDGKTHATGTFYGDNQESQRKSGDIEVLGNDGQPITTNNLWYSFLKSYETDVASYSGLCINSTEGGAYIKGTQVMSFKEAIDKHIQEKFYPLEKIKKFLDEFAVNEDEKKNLIKIIDETIKDIEGVVYWCKEGEKKYEKYKAELEDYIKNYKVSTKAMRDRVAYLQNELLEPKVKAQEKNKNFQLFLMHVVQPYYINFEVNMNALPDYYEDSAIAMADILYHHNQWYKTIGEITKICLSLLKETKNHITSPN
ncbi:motility associated factor glycosyltransferase family protein [Heliorestis acidaminivorans]|uniref:motility associated factor glycosyltransferase family protein n=1 Tax=Heliorestis acidaminivorans TaxID=553427 RepID=UPI0014791F17|nr:6-hydroxymethylpterin diphosphokinase MptE-like protein [Heliorestis acidaminivorans]